MARPSVGIWQLELQKRGFHLIFYDFDQHGVPLMRKISDLVITLENEKGEDIKIRTKKIDEARKNLDIGRNHRQSKSQSNSKALSRQQSTHRKRYLQQVS